MRCLNCDSTDLQAHVHAYVVAPLAQKGGSIITKGLVVKQTDVKGWWDGDEYEAKPIRGPIICGDCCEEHVYLKGLKPSLRKISYTEALQLGYEHFAADSEAGEEE